MSSTRFLRQPLQIYQDADSFDHAPLPAVRHAAAKGSSPLRLIKNASSRRNVVFNPPRSVANDPSPHKSRPNSSSSPPRLPFGDKLNMIAMPPPGTATYATDSMQKKAPSMSRFNTAPQKALFGSLEPLQTIGKENFQPNVYSTSGPYGESLAVGTFSIGPLYGEKPATKRILMDAPTLQESRPCKKIKAEPDSVASIADQLPVTPDDGTKPGHSYAMLIGMAILRAPNQRLTLAQIYKWISDNYSYYNATDAGWQNSIRHNLSLNKAFIKQERPKDDPGKGNYWAIEPGMESQFLKERMVRKPGLTSELSHASSSMSVLPPSQETMQSSYKAVMPMPLPRERPSSSSARMQKDSKRKMAEEVSSDATIPASDAVIPEDAEDEGPPLAISSCSQPVLSSPPAAAMHSSPPVAHHLQNADDTSPSVPQFPTSSRGRSHRRGFASMDDSGYFSSLNSSVLRGKGERPLTSEADRPRIKRGRAEEEIARLRGSSYDSPTKSRVQLTQGQNFVPASSSPLRRTLDRESKQMLPPLTPAVKLKPPQRAPPSASPNTNLRIHRDKVRELVGSPAHGIGGMVDSLSWSPAFQIDDSYMAINFDTEFDVFADTSDMLTVSGMGSPEKKPSMKRPGINRCHSTSILGDVANASLNRSMTSAPPMSFTSVPVPTLAPAATFESPLKLYGTNSPSKLQSSCFDFGAYDMSHEDFIDTDFLTEEVTEFDGMDIMQGFQKIGASSMNSGPIARAGSQRPGLGRSFTSRF